MVSRGVRWLLHVSGWGGVTAPFCVVLDHILCCGVSTLLGVCLSLSHMHTHTHKDVTHIHREKRYHTHTYSHTVTPSTHTLPSHFPHTHTLPHSHKYSHTPPTLTHFPPHSHKYTLALPPQRCHMIILFASMLSSTWLVCCFCLKVYFIHGLCLEPLASEGPYSEIFTSTLQTTIFHVNPVTRASDI